MAEPKSIVSISRCAVYNPALVRQSLLELFEPWGGIAYFIKPKTKVLLKPNLLAAATAEEAVTTHPVVVHILAEICREAGARVLIGDSPAGNCSWENLYRITGMRDAAEVAGADLVEFTDTIDTVIQCHSKKAIKYRMLPLARVLSEVDQVINVAKLKTHTLTGLTAAVKNMYGSIAGKTKGQLHLEHPRPMDFAAVILDIYQAVKPQLSIIDAVVAMEGTGPRNGRPRQVGLLLAAEDGNALDFTAAAIAGFMPEEVTTLAEARRQGLPGAFRENIELRGLSLEEAKVVCFDRGAVSSGKIGAILARFPGSWLRNRIEKRRPYPKVNPEKCTGCAVCCRHCPPQIIGMRGKRIEIDLGRCIRCYCCLELCSYSAIDLFPM